MGQEDDLRALLLFRASWLSTDVKAMSTSLRGLVHVYTGDGKGKTTAALGLALRAAGHGWRTYIGQFMKGQNYGELVGVRLVGDLITIEQFGKPTFVRLDADGRSSATQEDLDLARQGLDAIYNAMASGRFKIVVMDEINVVLYFRLLTVYDVIEVIEQKPDHVELVLTGRRVPSEILHYADYVTEMQECKHPYQRGIQARKGIEF